VKFGSPEYQQQAEELVRLSGNLTDEQKAIAEYWTASPDSDPPVVHWTRFAEFVSARDQHTLDDDVKMFFALSNALMDADIAAWDAKRAYDSVRPATAIPLLFRGKKIQSRVSGLQGLYAQTPRGEVLLANPDTKETASGKGATEIDGGQWLPYQPAASPTPPLLSTSPKPARKAPPPPGHLRRSPELTISAIRSNWKRAAPESSRKSLPPDPSL